MLGDVCSFASDDFVFNLLSRMCGFIGAFGDECVESCGVSCVWSGMIGVKTVWCFVTCVKLYYVWGVIWVV